MPLCGEIACSRCETRMPETINNGRLRLLRFRAADQPDVAILQRLFFVNYVPTWVGVRAVATGV